MNRYRVSVDIGGTFTDFVVHDQEASRAFTGKVLSTPHNPAEGVITGLRRLIADPSQIEFIVHGTTVGLNAFLQRRGTRVLIITTEGFRDVYIIARGDRKDLYNLHYSKPEPLVSSPDIFTVRERIRWDGSIQTPLQTEDFAPILDRAEAEGINAIAVCFLHGNINPVHELEARRLIQERLPEVSVSLSHEVTREWREYERTSTVALNAYIAPVTERYLASLESELLALGVPAGLHVMQSNGGVMTSAAARRLPIQTLLSGPVGGTIGGVALSQALDRPNLLCVDMGGTSFDVSLIVDGRLSVSPETALEGLPLLMSIVDIHTIGAGGGSLAWLEADALRVGPVSAGADPGPACYGRGGTEPTVTDANLLLGRINSGYFLGGGMRLDASAAEAAISRVAGRLGLTNEVLAEGMIAIINAKMADAMRTITIRRGIDPRDYALVAYGGAGPMHAIALAEELDISEVIVPWAPGTFSAWGMLQSDIRHDLSRPFYAALADTQPARIEATLDELAEHGRAVLATEAVAPEQMRFIFSADMRYVGQEYFINQVITGDRPLTGQAVAAIVDQFHDHYRVRYGHATPGAPVEIVSLRVAAIGLLPGRVAGFEPAAMTTIGQETRRVVFAGVARDAAILRRGLLSVGATFAGPAVIEEETATTVLPLGWLGRVDQLGNLILTPATT